jgi:hypothetical protein
MNFTHPSLKYLITGTSGSGKTHLFEQLIRAEPARVRFIYDHEGEFSKRFKKDPVTDGLALAEKTLLGGYVIFDPIQEFEGRQEEGFAFFCDYVLQVSKELKGRKLFCCDELQKLTSNREEPREFIALCETGRRYQIDVITISQAANRLHNAVRNQLTRVYTFRQSDENAIKYLSENGFNADEVRNLPKWRYLWRDLATGATGEGGPKISADKKGNRSSQSSGDGVNPGHRGAPAEPEPAHG